MGWTVLYIAFGIVALWLLGEVLLQYKARLRWRLLAFTGFLCVVAGAILPSVIVIGVGIAAFATGQTFVTLSYRRGFAAGWALNGMPGLSRRRDEAEDVMEAELEGPPLRGEFDAREPAPALAGPGGFGSDTFEMSALGAGSNAANGYGANGYETNGFETTAYGANGFEANGFETNGYGSNGYETRSFAAADASITSNGYDSYDNAQAYDPFSYAQVGYEAAPDPYQTATNGFGLQQTGQQPSVPVYQPGPLPDETGEFTPGAFDGGYPGADQPGIYAEQAGQQQYAAYSDPYYGYNNAGYTGNSFGDYDNYAGYGGIGDLPGYGQQQSPYGNGVADGFETSGFGADGYGTNGYGNGYGTDGYGTDAYGNGYGTDGYGAGYGMGGTYAGEQGSFPQAPTGGGGVWVPQQRDPYEQLQPEQQPYPYQNGDPNGYGAPGNGYYY